uniref:DUF3885 domain-containing protein n=1 Tax=Staphylococcus muscae TaxID=1294 RepID=UPI000D1398D6
MLIKTRLFHPYILFHLYDDRGFTITFSNEQDFQKFKEKYKGLEFEKYTEQEI